MNSSLIHDIDQRSKPDELSKTMKRQDSDNLDKSERAKLYFFLLAETR